MSTDILESALRGGKENKESLRGVAKELFKPQDMDQRTRVTSKEMTLVVRGRFIGDFTKSKGYKRFGDMVNKYYQGILDLRPSWEGRSREEFVNVHKEELKAEAVVEKTMRIQ